MSPKERAEQALIFLRQSEEEFAKNDIFQGSEKLWGAATQAVLAIASQENGKEPHTHREMKKLVMKLSETHEAPNLALQFAVAEGFHANFYHRWKDDFQIQADVPAVHDFVEQMLAIWPSLDAGQETEPLSYGLLSTREPAN